MVYLNTMHSLSETELRVAHPSVHRRRSRRLQVAAIRGPRRKNFRWGKDVRPRKLDEALSRHGHSARRGVESPSSPRERCSVYTVRRSIISMRDSNFIKKDVKNIPHFRRIVPYSERGRNARREGGGTILPCQGRAPYFTFEHDALSALPPPTPLTLSFG